MGIYNGTATTPFMIECDYCASGKWMLPKAKNVEQAQGWAKLEGWTLNHGMAKCPTCSGEK